MMITFLREEKMANVYIEMEIIGIGYELQMGMN